MTPGASQILVKTILYATIIQKTTSAIVQTRPLIWTKTVTTWKIHASPIPVKEMPLVWTPQEKGAFFANVLLVLVGQPVKLPLFSVAQTPANTEVFAIRTLFTLSASAPMDMLEGSVKRILMSVRPALATMGPYARMKSVAIPASVSQDIKAGTVTWKWMNVSQIPVRTKLHVSMK